MKVHECVSFVLIKDAEVLLETRAKKKDTDPSVIAIPGGHMEAGETPQQALFRELKEELNVVPTSFAYLCSLYHPTTELQLIHYYVIAKWNGEIECHEAECVDWYVPIDAPVGTEVDRIALKEFKRLENIMSFVLKE